MNLKCNVYGLTVLNKLQVQMFYKVIENSLRHLALIQECKKAHFITSYCEIKKLHFIYPLMSACVFCVCVCYL